MRNIEKRTWLGAIRTYAGLTILALIILSVAAKPGLLNSWNNDLVISTSADGKVFTPPHLFMPGGGVASLARNADGRLVAAFQWFPRDNSAAYDKVAVVFSEDDGTSWSAPVTVSIQDFPKTMVRPCDPVLVAMSGGKIRLYFTSGPKGPTLKGKERVLQGTYSAISDDGINYKLEPGVRFSLPGGQSVLNCTVAFLSGQWHYFAPRQGGDGAYHAISDDGLEFRREKDIPSRDHEKWLGCALPVKDGGLAFYGSSKQGIWRATSVDGIKWSPPELLPNLKGADPAVVATRNGGLMVVATGPPHGTISGEQIASK